MKIYFYKNVAFLKRIKKSLTFCTLRGSMVNMEPKCFQSSGMCISRMKKSLPESMVFSKLLQLGQ